MKELKDLKQIAKFARNDRTPFLCKCEVCQKTFVMQVRSLKNKNNGKIICRECKTKLNYPNKGIELRDKRQKTYMKKYRCKEFFQTKEFENKSKKTCLKKYNCEYVLQSKEFIEHALKVRYDKYKDVSFNRKYFYDEQWFDSSWELAYYIWLKDAHISFKYHPKFFGKYLGDDGKEHIYYPDFLVNGEYQEIKGNQFFNEKNEPFDYYSKTFWWDKYNFLLENNVRIIRKDDMKFIFNYIDTTYGKNFLKQFNIGKYIKKSKFNDYPEKEYTQASGNGVVPEKE